MNLLVVGALTIRVEEEVHADTRRVDVTQHLDEPGLDSGAVHAADDVKNADGPLARHGAQSIAQRYGVTGALDSRTRGGIQALGALASEESVAQAEVRLRSSSVWHSQVEPRSCTE